MDNSLAIKDINSFSKSFLENKENSISQRCVMANGINASCTDVELKNQISNTFSINIDSGLITNQQQSGRCWMFAGLNVIRTSLIEKLNVKNIELSQAYLQFYDKLEKANFFLERVIELAEEPYDSRLNVFLIDSSFMDGGHFAMFVNLVKKYGVIPSQFMPDSQPSHDTRELNTTLTQILTDDMAFLRNEVAKKATAEKLSSYKKKMLKEVYQVLAISLGEPPKDFTYEYQDKKDVFHRLNKLTPKDFYDQYIGINLDDYISLCDAPLIGFKPMTNYTCKYVNNMIGGEPVVFFNVPLKDLKNSVIASLKNKEPVWFSADVLSQSLRKEGYLVSGILKKDELFHISIKDDKKTRLSYRSSFCNHAMVFTGVNLKGNTPDRFKVENSWGKDNGTEGYFVMSNQWFNDYVYQVLVNKKYIKKDIVDAYLKSKPVEVSPFNALWKYED